LLAGGVDPAGEAVPAHLVQTARDPVRSRMSRIGPGSTNKPPSKAALGPASDASFTSIGVPAHLATKANRRLAQHCDAIR